MMKLYLSSSRYVTVLLLFVTSIAWSQSRTVTGKVTSGDDGSVIPGANVIEKGTANGVSTDADGGFSINVGDNATLVFSFVGYTSQEIVVGNVDEELRRGRMRLHGTGHGDGVLGVAQAVVRFVLDAWTLVFLFFHARLETAALDHEVADDAVENGVRVVAGVDVLDEVGHGDRGLFGVQLQDDVAVVGAQFDFGHAEIRSFKAIEIGCAGSRNNPDAQSTGGDTRFAAVFLQWRSIFAPVCRC